MALKKKKQNNFDPSLRFGYEEYSFLSQYNLLPASMLYYAWTLADDSITEGPCPAEVGGFAFQLDLHHKVNHQMILLPISPFVLWFDESCMLLLDHCQFAWIVCRV
jgi:hypothetical protein